MASFVFIYLYYRLTIETFINNEKYEVLTAVNVEILSPGM
jgi:hypothetical protein